MDNKNYEELHQNVEKFAHFMGRTLPPVGIDYLFDIVLSAYRAGFKNGVDFAETIFGEAFK